MNGTKIRDGNQVEKLRSDSAAFTQSADAFSARSDRPDDASASPGRFFVQREVTEAAASRSRDWYPTAMECSFVGIQKDWGICFSTASIIRPAKFHQLSG